MTSKGEIKPKPRTVSVPRAGHILGIGRNAAYRAAKNGELPTLRFGKRLVVPLDALNRKLQGGESPHAPEIAA